MPHRPPGSADVTRPSSQGGVPGPDARALAAQAEVAFLSAEAEAAADKSGAAVMHFEAGHILETELGDAKAAARAYKNALTADPTYQPTAWALRRQLTRQGQWENLLRVLDAEARFASNTRSEDRSDLAVERGWVLREHLGRVPDAYESFALAVQLDPESRVAWLALLLHVLAKGPLQDAPSGFDGLVAQAQNLAQQTAWSGAYAAWLLLPKTHAALALDPVHATQLAASVLFAALDAGATDSFVLATLDQLSLQPAHASLRPQVLERLVLAQGQDERQAHALAARLVAHREWVRCLVADGQFAAARAQLDAALALNPEHPLLAADRLDLASLEGRLDVFDEWQARATSTVTPAELMLRRVDVALRQGAWGEAMGALDQLGADPDLQDLCFVQRVRTLVGLADSQGLAEAYEAQAEVLWARHKAAEIPAAKDLLEVAHLFVRAGALWEVELADSLHAEALYGQAVALVSSYRPAIEGLASVFTREGRWERLVELVAADAAAAASSERAGALRESLVLLHRDVLSDLPAALAAQKLLVQSAPQDVRALFRWLDLAARLAGVEDAAVDDVCEAIKRLFGLAGSPQSKAALAQLAVWFVQGGPRDYEADAWLERALANEPRALAAAFVERRERVDSARGRTVLQRELDAWARHHEGASRVRALRFRQAFRALETGDVAAAVGELEPLCPDDAAAAWQVEIARRSRDPQIIRRLLAAADLAPALSVRLELTILLAECLEAAGRRQEAAQTYNEASYAAQAGLHTELVVRAALGRLRVAAADTDIASVMMALRDLGEALPNSLGEALVREAQYVLLATGGALHADALATSDPVLAFVAALRSTDDAFALGLQAVAQAAPAGPARGGLWFALGLHGLLHNKADALQALHAAVNDNPTPEAQVVLTDLPATANGPNNSHVVAARLQDLARDADAHDEPSAALASLLALESGAVAESEGRLTAAAEAYAQVLRWRPHSLEALEGLRRLAQLAGARHNEAALLERIADTLVGARAAAEHYAEAALLFEAEGHAQNAMRLFYKVLSRAPDDDEAFDRLLLLLRQAEQWDRAEKLVGFKLTRLSHSGPRCVPLWLERARLRSERLANPEGAVADWRRALAVDARVFEALWRLGQAAQTQAAWSAARRRLQAALAAPNENVDTRVACLIDLAEVCASSLDNEAARAHLRAAKQWFSQMPGPLADLLDRLVPQCLRARCHDVAVAALETVAAAQTEASARAVCLLRVARLWREAHDVPEARENEVRALLRALQADPFGDAASELAALEPAAVLTREQQQTLQAANAQVLQHVRDQGLFDARNVETVRAFAHVVGPPWRRAIAGQLLFLLGHGESRGHARNATGTLTLQELFSLGAETSSPGVLTVQAVWPALQNGVSKAWLTTTPLPSISRATRVDANADARLAWVQSAMQVLQLEALSVHQVGLQPLVTVAGGSAPVLILGGPLLAGDPASRFRVARALALLRLGLGLAANQNEASVARWASGALAAAGAPEAVSAAAGGDICERVQHALPRRSLRALEPLAPDLQRLTPEDVEAWLRQCSQSASCFALLVAGDLAESVFALTGSRDIDEVAANEAARSLVRFALSDGYGKLRRTLGLDAAGEDHV